MGLNLKVAKPPPPKPESWWDSVPGRITKWCSAIVAIFTVITGAIAIYQKLLPPTPPSPPPPLGSSSGEAPKGAVGWIYVGTRLGNKWTPNIETDRYQPALTLNVTGMPERALTYRLTSNVNVRASLPEQSEMGVRPVMPPKMSFLMTGRQVTVDDIREFNIKDKEGRVWTWIWAHITVAS
jgi:hypothetical protein